MAQNRDDETVREILRRKRGSIRTAALEPGSPSWDDILDLTCEEISRRARSRKPGYKTFKKLLSAGEYDK
jgi:hypothetical protein